VAFEPKESALVALPDEGCFEAACATVNGEPLTARRELLDGDVVAVGETHLVCHRAPFADERGAVLFAEEIRLRLRQEVERAARYGGSFAVLVAELDGARERDAAKIGTEIVRAVRFVDVVGRTAANEYAVILPETADAAVVPARRLLSALRGIAPECRIGLARYPEDGVDADSLLSSAQSAYRRAMAGAIAMNDEPTIFALEDGLEIAIADPAMARLIDKIRDLARSDIPVLILGETGVGKELVARALHEWSPRRGGKMVSINCAAVAESLLESELFGHERGAFTGAAAEKAGLLESASGGTVFLDEIGDSSQRVQAGLLRVLETRLVRRVGALAERPIDVRIIAASNRPLTDEDERFRRDLFYRLSAAMIVVPPLRERPLDVPMLIRRFVARAAKSAGRGPLTMTPEAMARMQLYSWPGNVREMKNLVEYLASVVHGAAIEVDHLPENVRCSRPWHVAEPKRAESADGRNARRFPRLADEIRELERTRIEEALESADGVRVRAAELIGMPLRTLLTKMKAYALDETPSGRRRKDSRG